MIQTALQATSRRYFIGGSDAGVIMGSDQARLLRLWREKRGEVEPANLSGVLAVQLGRVTEALNLAWYERNTGHRIGDIQRRAYHHSISFMTAALDGIVENTGAVFEAKFMLPWTFSEEGAAAKHMAQLQHNMLVVDTKNAVLSIITGGGKWLAIQVTADPIYQTALIAAEKAFWHAVETGDQPRLFGTEPPRARVAAVNVVDMSSSNSWTALAATFHQTRAAHLDHEQARIGLKNLVPVDACQASGHGIRAKRSKSGAVSLDVVDLEGVYAAV